MTSRNSKSTLVDVAREVGVAPMTVSRALHKPEKVAPDTRNKILEACKRLNYRPNASARSLRTKTSHQVGVIIPDWQNPFWIDVVGGIEAILTRAGFQLLIANSNEEGERQALEIDAILSRSVDGLLIAPTVDSAQIIHELVEAGSKIVVIDRLPPGLDGVHYVTVDNEAGAYKATKHLLDEGHRQIGLLAGNINLDTGQQRLDGYLRALQEQGLRVNDQWIRTAETNAALVGKQIGYKGTLEFLDMANRPTALLCTSNTIVIGALLALQERYIRIPQEMAIVSFGNLEWTSLLTPPLTVVTQPTFAMGSQAAQMLIDYLGSESENESVRLKTLLQPELIIRGSSTQ
jgi:DNA-binding LacI/PurR family transcriptional regulator